MIREQHVYLKESKEDRLIQEKISSRELSMDDSKGMLLKTFTI